SRARDARDLPGEEQAGDRGFLGAVDYAHEGAVTVQPCLSAGLHQQLRLWDEPPSEPDDIDVVQDASGTCDHGAGRVDTRDLHRADPVLPADLGHRVAAEEGDSMARQQARVLSALG